MQWLMGLLFPLLITYLLSVKGVIQVTFEWVTVYPFNMSIWLPLSLLFILTLNQVFYSYRMQIKQIRGGRYCRCSYLY